MRIGRAGAVVVAFVASAVVAEARQAGVPQSIFVYDNNTQHGLAQQAAQNLSPGGTVVAGSSTFNGLLTSGAWDVVLVDCPGTVPSGGWQQLAGFVNGGGRVVMSFWDWDGSFGDPVLLPAFQVSLAGTISLTGKTLFDSGTSDVFAGVTMPYADWHGHWGDDGDQFTPLGSAVGLAHVGTTSAPVLVLGNDGRTIAGPLFDEAGGTWLADGSGVKLWENMALAVSVPPGPDILVYDDDSVHGLARAAALEHSPGGTVVADSSSFNALLAGGPWDLVAVDCPGTTPLGGWGALTAYVADGGRAVVSFWDWDASSGFGDPAFTAAFDVAVAASISLSGRILHDAGTSDVFAGVPVPATGWHDHWNDDGDEFTVDPSVALGLAHLGDPDRPVLVKGNAGRTIASFAIDEASSAWLLQGGVQLWRNLMDELLGRDASCRQRPGALGLDPEDLACAGAPVVGQTWTPAIDPTPLVGTSTQSTILAFGLGGPTEGAVVLGYELLVLPPYVLSVALGDHAIAIPPDPELVGVPLTAQGARLEATGAGLVPVLTNAVDLVLGL